MQLFKKQKFCYPFFVAFLESTSNFQHFERKDQLLTRLYPIISKTYCCLNVLRAML